MTDKTLEQLVREFIGYMDGRIKSDQYDYDNTVVATASFDGAWLNSTKFTLASKEYQAIKERAESATRDDLSQDEKIKYKTVEGHPVVAGRKYETDNGEKVKVVGFISEFVHAPVIGYTFPGVTLTWTASGFIETSVAWYEEGYNLMRPWVDDKWKCNESGNDKDIVSKDGWIPHTTGKQPVGDDVMVEVQFKDNVLEDLAKRFDWDRYNPFGSYIRNYRIVEERKTLKKYMVGTPVCNHSAEAINSVSDYIEEILIPYLESKDE